MPQSVKVEVVKVEIADLEPAEFQESLTYWNSLRGERFAPGWRDFDLMRLSSKIIPYFTVVDVERDPLDFIYRFWGTRHVEAKGRELTGKSVRALRPPEVAEAIFEQYRQVVEARAPMAFLHRIHGAGMQLPLMQTTLRMPLSNDRATIDKVVCYSDWSAHTKLREFYLKHMGRA